MVAETTGPWTVGARWIFPVAGTPLEGGTVTIDADRIVAVQPHGARRPDVELGNVALLPGFVNAHTHLDLTGLRGQAPPSADFVGWLRAVIQHRRVRSRAQVEADIRAGLAESLAGGTTLLGDIAAQGWSWDALAEAPLRSVVFFELLGLPADRATESLDCARTWLAEHDRNETCRLGLSPHAPYSVRFDLIARAARLARRTMRPLAIHVAETLAELELLQQHRGPFVAFLKELGVWDPVALAESLEHVMKVCDQRIPKLFVHGNYLAPDVRLPRQSTIVYCPRTHAAFGHASHPFRAFLARGVRVALGTDSLASNPDLDLLAEVRFLHRQHPDVDGATLLSMATRCGAEALGFADVTGTLAAGKSADLVVLPLPDVEGTDPHELFLDSAKKVEAVLLRGRWLDLPGLRQP